MAYAAICKKDGNPLAGRLYFLRFCPKSTCADIEQQRQDEQDERNRCAREKTDAYLSGHSAEKLLQKRVPQLSRCRIRQPSGQSGEEEKQHAGE